MTIRARLTRILAIFAALFVLLAGAFIFVPWKSLLEDRLKSLLEAQGLPNVQLSVSKVGLHTLTLYNVAWGDPRHPTSSRLSQLTLDYSPWEILSGHVSQLDIRGLTLEGYQTAGKWFFAGMNVAEPRATSFALPVSESQIAAFPSAAALNDSRLRLKAETWSLDLPVQISWWKTPAPQLAAQSDRLVFKGNAIAIETGETEANATLNPEKRTWFGAWTLKEARVFGLDAPFPSLDGKGTLAATEDEITLQGVFQSPDSLSSASFQVQYRLSAPEASRVILKDASFPWNGGTIRADGVVIPLGKRQAVNIDLKMQNISLDALLKRLTGDRASGSGVISGTLPITLHPDNSFQLRDGRLAAESPGVIQMPPEAIPGDNPQISLVRDVLKNLNYTTLSLDVENDPDNRLVILMTVEGNNPDVSQGQAVKLNVKLTGDVLDFIQQNMSLTDPRKYLEQNDHANP